MFTNTAREASSLFIRSMTNSASEKTMPTG